MSAFMFGGRSPLPPAGEADSIPIRISEDVDDPAAERISGYLLTRAFRICSSTFQFHIQSPEAAMRRVECSIEYRSRCNFEIRSVIDALHYKCCF